MLHPAAPRLACVKPVASVHPEPGSNSSLFKLFLNILAPESVIVVQSHTSLTVSIRKINFPILVLLVELCKSLKELLSLSFLDCGCKGKDFFLTSKFFGEKFSSFFLKPISGRLEIIAWPSQPHPLPKDTSTFPSFLKRRSLSKAGAKVYAFIITSKFYNDFF